MKDPEATLGALVQQALADELGSDYSAADPLIRPSGFADYQSNVAMSLSKQLGRPPGRSRRWWRRGLPRPTRLPAPR